MEQYNIIVDVLGGYSVDVEERMIKLMRKKGNEVFWKVQNAVISCTLNIALSFKTHLLMTRTITYKTL